LILESSSTFQECIHNTKNKEGEYAAQKGVAKIAKIYSIRRDCIGLFLHKNGEAITALFTVVLAFSTIALWLSTRELWRVTDKTLEHSEDTARKQLRAYMSAEPDGVILFNPPDRVVGRVRFLNTGAVFAKDVRSKVKKQLSENGDLPEEAFPIDESELTGDNVIAPRADIRYASEAILKSEIDDGRRAAKDGPFYLYIWGMIEYHDGFTPKRFTKFCHRYNFSSLGANEYIIRKEDYRYHHRGNKIYNKD
jgi:hypothetical protein